MGSTMEFCLVVRFGSAIDFGTTGVGSMGFTLRLFLDCFAVGCFSVPSEMFCVSVARLRPCRNLETSFDKAG